MGTSIKRSIWIRMAAAIVAVLLFRSEEHTSELQSHAY